MEKFTKMDSDNQPKIVTNQRFVTNEGNNSERIITKINSKFTNEDIENLSKFIEDYDPSNLNPETVPSIVSIGGPQEISIIKIDPRDAEKYLWMHPVIPRGIEIKANRMTRRGFAVVDGKTPDKEYTEYCRKILANSGGVKNINQWIQDAFGFGDGYRTLVLNEAGTEVLRINREHPVFFTVAKYNEKENKKRAGKFKISRVDKKPLAYTQLMIDNEDKLIPTGKEIPRDRVAHLFFDSWGDEPVGISLVQYLQLTLKYIMNMEEAAAETIFRNGFIQKKVTTDIRTDKGLRALAKNLTEINSRDALILPKGTDVENLVPSSTEFPQYHERFITQLSIRIGVPKPILTQEGISTNKSTLREMMKDVAFDYSMDELVVEEVLTNEVFVSSCKVKFKDSFDINKVPEFKFNVVPEDKEVETEILVNRATYINTMANSIKTLIEAGEAEVAKGVSDELKSKLEGLETN